MSRHATPFVPRRVRADPTCDLHPIDCPCPPCIEARDDVDRPLTPNQIASWCMGGVLFGNLLAFAANPSGAWEALTAALRQMAGL